jgi:hypothetical protein
MAMVSATVVWANPGGVMREVFYDVNIVVNGTAWNPPADMVPFISQGRTFLPVRGIAELFDVPVDWDGSTMTVFVGTVPHGAPLLQVAPQFEGSGRSVRTINMLGNTYSAIVADNSGSTWSHHNLNGQFNTITGTIGRIDGSGTRTSSISFIGDGRELASFSIDGNSHPTDISVDVRGVLILRIVMNNGWGLESDIAFANAMIQ